CEDSVLVRHRVGQDHREELPVRHGAPTMERHEALHRVKDRLVFWADVDRREPRRKGRLHDQRVRIERHVLRAGRGAIEPETGDAADELSAGVVRVQGIHRCMRHARAKWASMTRTLSRYHSKSWSWALLATRFWVAFVI